MLTKPTPEQLVDLGIDLRTFRPDESIDLHKACDLYLRGRGGKPLSLQVAWRYASASWGCRPLGEHGPVLILPTVRWSGQLRTMPAWCQAFERRRVELGIRLRTGA